MPVNVVTSISDEAGEYESALGRAHVEVTRTGVGVGPNATREVVVDGADMVSGHIQFPVIGRATIGDDQMAAISIVHAPAGSRWCERDLEPGQVMLYGPGAEHYGVSPPGMEFRYAVIELSELHAVGELLGTTIRPPHRGSVTWVDATAATSDLRSVLVGLGDPLHPTDATPRDGTELFEATTHVLADPSSLGGERQRRTISSRSVVSTCVDYAEEVGRIPSVSELCCCVHVSERRLRAAFSDACGLSPNQFFRTRFLGRARDRLLAPRGHTITEIAFDVGFTHVGRFALQYQELFGERPSETLLQTGRSTPHTAS